MATEQSIIPIERIERLIYLIRGQKVMLDSDLADLYDVTTGALNQAVKRNIDRFPKDFAFQLTPNEFEALISQTVISKSPGRGGRRKLPWVFTEQGVAMRSSVLKSKRAVQVNIQIMRTFVELRKMIASNAALARKIKALEKKYNKQFRVVFVAIRQLLEVEKSKKSRRIDFRYFFVNKHLYYAANSRIFQKRIFMRVSLCK